MAENEATKLKKSLAKSREQVRVLKERIRRNTFIVGLLISILVTLMSMIVYQLWY